MDVDTAGPIGDVLPAMLSAGVPTSGTDVTALERFGKAANGLRGPSLSRGDVVSDPSPGGRRGHFLGADRTSGLTGVGGVRPSSTARQFSTARIDILTRVSWDALPIWGASTTF
jgi:hypothetical protein